MFEEVTDSDELQLAIVLPELKSVPYGQLISLDSTTESLVLKSGFDAIFVGGLSDHLTVDERSHVFQIIEDNGIELVQFENPSNDLTVIREVVVNLAGKLFSGEMPNNVSLTDIRNVNFYSDCLFAFNTMCSALDFLKTQSLGSVVGGIFVAHGDISLIEYHAAGDDLLSHFAEEGYFCSSIYASGTSECTILLGVQYHSN
ncbi:MAG: hypothetical protein VW258_14730 [Thalassolituus sp.]